MAAGQKTLLIFDFDGVLSADVSGRQARPYPNIKEDIRALAATGDYVMAIASFNPCAPMFLERWGMLEYFTCVRAGSNHPWADEGEYDEAHPSPPFPMYFNTSFDEIYWDGVRFCKAWRLRATKSKQIKSMLAKELSKEFSSRGFHTIVFFDDYSSNIADVNNVFSHRARKRAKRQGGQSPPLPPLPHVECVYVQPRHGFQTNLLPLNALYI